MENISPKSISLTGLETFAAEADDLALQIRADELREMVGEPTRENSLTTDQQLVLNIRSAWRIANGNDIKTWPKRLQAAFNSMAASVGLPSFENDVAVALRNLQLFDDTIPAYEAVMNMIPSPFGVEGQGEGVSFIPSSAARAGLHFFSNPINLMAPILAGSLTGRMASVAVSNFGRAVAMADEAFLSISAAAGIFGEATGFVMSSLVIASVAKQSSESDPANGIASVALLPRNDMATDIVATSAFFASLRMFSWAGRLLGSLAPMRETGLAAAKAVQHASSITGLAMTEGVQEAAGIAPATGDDIWTRMVRAAFLHGAITSVNGLAKVEASRIFEIPLRDISLERPVLQAAVSGSGTMIPYPSFDISQKDLGRANMMSEPPSRPPGGRGDEPIGEKPPQGSIEDTVENLVAYGFDRPAQEYIKQLLPKIVRYVTEISPAAGKEAIASAFSKRLRSADYEILRYIHEVVDTANGTSFLLLLDRLGLVPNGIKIAVQLAVNTAAQRRAGDGTINAAVYTLESSYRARYGKLPDRDTITARLACLPQELVQFLNNLTPFHESHLKTAEKLGVLDLPR